MYTASMSYWIFTDIFEERGPQTRPFYGGFGLFNLEGIRKPSFFAYKYLVAARLRPTSPQPTPPTSPGSPSPQVRNNRRCRLSSGTTHPSPRPAARSIRPSTRRRFPHRPVTPVDLMLEHLTPGPYTVTVYRTGLDHNDPFTAWLRHGLPGNSHTKRSEPNSSRRPPAPPSRPAP